MLTHNLYFGGIVLIWNEKIKRIKKCYRQENSKKTNTTVNMLLFLFKRCFGYFWPTPAKVASYNFDFFTSYLSKLTKPLTTMNKISHTLRTKCLVEIPIKGY
jgi:5-bromo-4-chloroindolyl phosphate hydrolysis protein